MKSLDVECRKYKNSKSDKDRTRLYRKENVRYSKVEESIYLEYNIKTERKVYHVVLEIQGKKFEKRYLSLEQARIFRDTIIKNLTA